jgi:hypothetical protein
LYTIKYNNTTWDQKTLIKTSAKNPVGSYSLKKALIVR